ncbi:hypothetical protein CVT26_007864 [Gymnopilus dilepis]|uniref:Uncharacterized protein n=1 Tax=Gymnopilus dilepis TaxID=231916 RepID=A0A409YKA8_9AGAR|nr:hypothetical protein CVT26_007864 [Gymnopilus dilepis]
MILASTFLSVCTVDDGALVSQRSDGDEVPGAFVERDDIEKETAPDQGREKADVESGKFVGELELEGVEPEGSAAAAEGFRSWFSPGALTVSLLPSPSTTPSPAPSISTTLTSTGISLTHTANIRAMSDIDDMIDILGARAIFLDLLNEILKSAFGAVNTLTPQASVFGSQLAIPVSAFAPTTYTNMHEPLPTSASTKLDLSTINAS